MEKIIFNSHTIEEDETQIDIENNDIQLPDRTLEANLSNGELLYIKIHQIKVKGIDFTLVANTNKYTYFNTSFHNSNLAADSSNRLGIQLSSMQLINPNSNSNMINVPVAKKTHVSKKPSENISIPILI